MNYDEYKYRLFNNDVLKKIDRMNEALKGNKPTMKSK